MPSMRLDRTSGGRARRHPQPCPPCAVAPGAPTGAPPEAPQNSYLPPAAHGILPPSPGLHRDTHALQRRLPMTFLGPQDTEPSSLSPTPAP